jgi:hypothetical protein
LVKISQNHRDFFAPSALSKGHRWQKSSSMILQKLEAEHMALAICGFCQMLKWAERVVQ